jgi:thioredoxin reductase (NADPH)
MGNLKLITSPRDESQDWWHDEAIMANRTQETVMSETEITVYGAHWCPECRQSRLFLGEHQIPYHWVDIEQDPEAERFVMEKNAGKRIISTIIFGDGTFLTEPNNAQLAARLGLKTEALRSHYDLIVVGGGPAGLAAALYIAREAIDTLVIERAAFGGQTAGTEKFGQHARVPGGHCGNPILTASSSPGGAIRGRRPPGLW